MKQKLLIMSIILVSCLIIGLGIINNKNKKEDFNSYVLKTIMLVDDGGGYYTGRAKKEELDNNAWEGMDNAVILENGKVEIDLSKAKPSFCSSAIYMALLNSLSNWDKEGIISYEAWKNLKPYTVEGRDWPIQADGVGCWGRGNANGPGFAVLIEELGAGKNIYLPPKDSFDNSEDYYDMWKNIEPGDFIKIFWNEYIGANDELSEKGHMVIFLDYEEIIDENGQKDGLVYYWSSNGSGYKPDKGYGIGKARLSKIYRAISTHIDNPAAFNNAKNIQPDNVNSFLSALDGKYVASEEELIQSINGEKIKGFDNSKVNK